MEVGEGLVDKQLAAERPSDYSEYYNCAKSVNGLSQNLSIYSQMSCQSVTGMSSSLFSAFDELEIQEPHQCFCFISHNKLTACFMLFSPELVSIHCYGVKINCNRLYSC